MPAKLPWLPLFIEPSSPWWAGPTGLSSHLLPSSSLYSLHSEPALRFPLGLVSLLPTLQTPAPPLSSAGQAQEQPLPSLSIHSHLESELVVRDTSWSRFPALEDALEKVLCCRHSSLAAHSQDIRPGSSFLRLCVFMLGNRGTYMLYTRSLHRT